MSASRHFLAAENSVLVVIDVQERLLPKIHDHEKIERNIVDIIRVAGMFGVPVMLTEQYAKGLGPTVSSIRSAYDACPTRCFTTDKTAFSCCGDAGFVAKMAELEKKAQAGKSALPLDVVLAGIETHVCVLQTAYELLAAGKGVTVAFDCVGSRDKHNYKNALKQVVEVGGAVSNFESIAFMWARTKDHSNFKELNEILKQR